MMTIGGWLTLPPLNLTRRMINANDQTAASATARLAIAGSAIVR